MKTLVLSEPSRPARSASDPDPEVPAKARRRKFTAKYKVETLKEVEACTEPGEIGALLRRRGLYSSHLSKWRQQRDEGVLAGLRPKKRGRKPRKVSAEARRAICHSFSLIWSCPPKSSAMAPSVSVNIRAIVPRPSTRPSSKASVNKALRLPICDFAVGFFSANLPRGIRLLGIRLLAIGYFTLHYRPRLVPNYHPIVTPPMAGHPMHHARNQRIGHLLAIGALTSYQGARFRAM